MKLDPEIKCYMPCHLEAAARGSKILLLDRVSLPMQGYPELLRRAIENILRNAVRLFT